MTGPRRDPDLVRAYVRTGGRSRPTRQLDLVTVIVAAELALQGGSPDARRICALCRDALSLAEIAAHLDLPPSVVKIVVADLLDSGHLITRTPVHTLPDVSLLEEVLNGLRALAV
ncbi:DUF742 domain-containing protein [Nocardia sp. SYP-A9097]|uniref:DUF742 domain-containing protein n=1 Tax=Nocardia sp. SYP-A9097 TaxID=2663237 RepID=UPI0013253251|nr:DUF742 domain-containing protein [Nocardia sp. SYP-A9097]MRH88167.1 DUF742 domain-containing protein [Nocardia sp. SYP-A9097]